MCIRDSQINILWNTQRIAGMGQGIEYGEIFAKAMFAAQMIEFDLSNRAPSIWASDEVADIAAASGGGRFGDMSAEEGLIVSTYQSLGIDELYDHPLEIGNITAEEVKGIFYNANDGHGNCVGITCDIGPVLVAGLGAPCLSMDEAPFTECIANSTARAHLLGFNDNAQFLQIDAAIYLSLIHI